MLEVPPASPPWVVGSRSGVGLWAASLVYKQNASSTVWERLSAGPLGQILSEACLSGNRLCLPALQGSWGSTPWIVSALAWRSTVQSGLRDVRRPWRTDLGWTPHSVPGAAPPPSPLSLGLAQVVLKSGLRFVSQVGPHPQGAGIPTTTKRGAPQSG